MCFIYVELLCAVRFGLGWALDDFYVAYHMLMHFHAYIPLFLYILILICLVLFCVSLSLSPSLFLALVYSMAPKRKSTPSWNLLHSRASSSNSIPSHVKFHDEKAKSDFSENFSWCGIHSECQVILSDFSNTNLPIVIYSRGSESLCGIPVTCSFVIIQEFYSNMHVDTLVPHFVTRVWGTCIAVTLDIVSEVPYILTVVHPVYPSCDHLRTVSKDELSPLFCETPSSWGDH